MKEIISSREDEGKFIGFSGMDKSVKKYADDN
jgi:hypothetical protein